MLSGSYTQEYNDGAFKYISKNQVNLMYIKHNAAIRYSSTAAKSRPFFQLGFFNSISLSRIKADWRRDSNALPQNGIENIPVEHKGLFGGIGIIGTKIETELRYEMNFGIIKPPPTWTNISLLAKYRLGK